MGSVNVLLGQMSLVGPRPQIPKYIDIYPEPYRRILHVRPGITGLASVKLHRVEEEVLSKADNPEEVYIKKILPQKFRYEYFYMKHQDMVFDLRILWWTAMLLLTKR